MEYLAADRWQFKAWAQCATSGTYTCGVLAAYEGILQDYFRRTLDRLLQLACWGSLRPLGRTISSSCYAFSMLYAMECALGQLVLCNLRGFPWILFSLVAPFGDMDVLIATILQTPQCLLDSFAMYGLRRCSTPSLLKSATCRVIRIAMVFVLRFQYAG